MSVSSQIVINGEQIDITIPCDVLVALRKAEMKIVTGNQRLTVRFEEDEVTYGKANIAGLRDLIRQYDGLCRAAKGEKRRRSAIGVRWV